MFHFLQKISYLLALIDESIEGIRLIINCFKNNIKSPEFEDQKKIQTTATVMVNGYTEGFKVNQPRNNGETRVKIG